MEEQAFGKNILLLLLLNYNALLTNSCGRILVNKLASSSGCFVCVYVYTFPNLPQVSLLTGHPVLAELGLDYTILVDK